MKISIKNLGAVKSAVIDLKPLTIFVGDNNTGKSWTAYLCSAIVGPWGYAQIINSLLESDLLSTQYPALDEIVNKILSEGKADLDMINFFDHNGEKYYNDIGRSAPKWVSRYFGLNYVSLNKLKIKIDIEENKEAMRSKILATSLDDSISPGPDGRGLLNFIKEPGNPKIIFFTKKGFSENDIPKKEIKQFVLQGVFFLIGSAYNPSVNYFPIERAALDNFDISFMLSSEKKLQQFSKNEIKSEKPTNNIFMPYGFFYDQVSKISKEANYNLRLSQAKHDKFIKKCLILADILENQILEGNVDYSIKEPDPSRKLLYKLNNEKDVVLDLSNSASMVKDLSSIVIHLRYYVEQEGELFVIDEPEMNLHPLAQVKIIEFLALLANSGFNILITTHSPYLVDHLTNLMKAAKSKKKNEIKEKFFLRNANSFIKQEKVSVLLFANGQSENILQKDGLIKWDTFGNISKQIEDLYFEI
jgi:predicted ATPase